jgi:multidrug efflux pump subunit AcrA (membrane-fusion protein)
VATKAISTDTFETRVKTATEASESVLAAEAALQAAQLELEFTQVRAPIAGRISNARITAGNLVTGGSMANATLLTTIVSLDPIYCYLDADEASVLRYRQLYREGSASAPVRANLPKWRRERAGLPHKGKIDRGQPA